MTIRILARSWLFFSLLVGTVYASGISIDIEGTAEKYKGVDQETAVQAVPLRSLLEQQELTDRATHMRWALDFDKRIWEWQLFSTQVMFYVVMGVVVFGLWITYQQFKRDYTGRARPDYVRADAARPDKEAAVESVDAEHTAASTKYSTIKIGPEGMEITSQLVGLLILALSLAFFYFYVVTVYPMREIERDKATTSSSVKAKQ